jgi:magnesium transporter
LRQLLGLKQAKHEPKLKPDDLPANATLGEDGQEGNLFYVGRTLTAKAPNELRLRCTEFDENGNVTLVNGEFKKSELIAKVSFSDLLLNWESFLFRRCGTRL